MVQELHRGALTLLALGGLVGAGPPVLAVGGDVFLDTGGAPSGRDLGRLRGADLALINLETPACEGAPLPCPGGPRCQRRVARPEALRRLGEWGVDIASLANNHALDCGRAGADLTRARLRALGLDTLGTGERAARSVIRTARGARVAFLAATPVAGRAQPGFAGQVALFPWGAGEARLIQAVRRARQQATVVVLSVHWGVEGARGPGPAHRALARQLAAAGADLIVGHGGHHRQPVRFVGGALVFWDLGDAVRAGHPTGGVERVRLSHPVVWLDAPR